MKRRVHKLTVLSLLVLGVFLGAMAGELSAQTLYGVPWNADGITNLRAGDVSRYEASFRFKALYSDVVTWLRWYNIYSYTKPGYHKGTGGQLLIQIQTDDPVNHHPSGTALTQVVFPEPAGKDIFPLVAFDVPAYLQKGQLYHIVFKNIDPDPVNNFISMNTLESNPVLTPRQPGAGDLDLASLMRYSVNGQTTDWITVEYSTPIFELWYNYGKTQGVGYIFATKKNEQKDVAYTDTVISKVRQSIKPKSAILINSMWARLKKVGNPTALRAEITDASGKVLAYGYRAFSATGSYVWVKWGFVLDPNGGLSILRLEPNQQYYLSFRLTSNNGDANKYVFFPLQEGGHYGFTGQTRYADGYAQYQADIDQAWKGWTLYNVDNRVDCDLQFYFEITYL